MEFWFWQFLFYSFLGFLFEVVFARLTRNPKRDRKCRFLLPLCPVYGLGALALLQLPEAVRVRPLLLFFPAAALCTGVEYVTGLFYEKVLRTPFWDYRALPLNLGGKVCLPFSLLWGAMTVLLAPLLQPAAANLAAAVPRWLTPPAAVLFLLDSGVTFWLLRTTGDTGTLRWYDRLRVRRTA